jgi:hypothetical protein
MEGNQDMNNFGLNDAASQKIPDFPEEYGDCEKNLQLLVRVIPQCIDCVSDVSTFAMKRFRQYSVLVTKTNGRFAEIVISPEDLDIKGEVLDARIMLYLTRIKQLFCALEKD